MTKPTPAQLPLRTLLGSDPEPLGTERYERLMTRVGARRLAARRAVASRRRRSH